MRTTRNSASHRATIEVIAELREAASVSQRELSQRLNRPHNYVYLVEIGQRMLYFSELLDYLHHIGADPLEALREIIERTARPRKPLRTFGRRGPRPKPTQ